MHTELSRVLICLAANSVQGLYPDPTFGVGLSAGQEAALAGTFLAVIECLLEYGRFTQ